MRGFLLVLLTVAAGCVDAISYLGLGSVMTAAMTGNTILLGIALGQGKLDAALRSGIALVAFVAGTVIAAAIPGQATPGTAWPRAVTVILVLELTVLMGLACGAQLVEGGAETIADPAGYALIGAAGVAMGMQSVAALRVGVSGVSTTYVTGTLATGGVRLAGWLLTLWSGANASRHAAEAGPHGAVAHGQGSLGQGPHAREPHGHGLHGRGPEYPALVWLAYGVGAAIAGMIRFWWPTVAGSGISVGIAGNLHWLAMALSVPILVVAVVVAVAAIGFWGNQVPRD